MSDFGVYFFMNTVNGKMYVGKGAKNKKGECNRWTDHEKFRGKQAKPPITLAIEKYGIDKFMRGWLEEGLTEQEAYEQEVKWIAFYDSTKLGYNIHKGGRGGASVPWNEARRNAEEQRRHKAHQAMLEARETGNWEKLPKRGASKKWIAEKEREELFRMIGKKS